MNAPSTVLAGCFDKIVWVRVEGRGTFQNSTGLKEFIRQMIRRGFRDFVVDLGPCESMDSTFMGTLAGIALRLREIGQGTLRTINVNPRNSELLENLGLDHLFGILAPGAADAPIIPEEPVPLPVPAGGSADSQQTVLSAHEALVEANAANASRFKDVLELLRQEASDPAQEA